jgi:hypothetical protein
MTRIVISLIIGIGLGIGLGLYVGWVQLPVEYVDSPLSFLDQAHMDDYTVMVAAGYTADHDLQGAVDRLRALNITNVPTYVQLITERYISQGRSVTDIRQLVALAEAMGRLTPLMEAYRSLPGQ